MLGSGVSIAAGKSVSIGGFCLDVNWVHKLNEFQFPGSFRISADLYSATPACTLPNCKLFCGDLVCKSPTETATTCPMDCNPLTCPSSRRFLSKIFRGANKA